MPKYINADEYIKYCEENWIVLNVDAVNEQPAADVAEVRHGRWVRAAGMMPPEAFGVYECSLCGYMQDYHIPTRMREKTPFCPGCGAKMDGEEVDADI